MTDRKSRHQLSKLEKLVSTALKEREEREKQAVKELPFRARRHATAVAAIVLSGQPKIDEPLIKAWARALQHYGINVNVLGGIDDQVRAAQRLLPIIIGGEELSVRFTEIFRTAPVWLLQFTGISMDARLLKKASTRRTISTHSRFSPAAEKITTCSSSCPCGAAITSLKM